MNTSTHPIEQEELMAYLDGEVQEARAAQIAGHLEGCEDCRAFVGQIENVSQKVRGWEIEAAPAGLFLPVLAEADKPDLKEKWFGKSDRVFKVALAGVCLIVVIGAVRLIGTSGSKVSTRTYIEPGSLAAAVADARKSKQFDRLEQFSKLQSPPAMRDHSPSEAVPEASTAVGGGLGARDYPDLTPGPMIERTASIGVVVQEFDGSRSRLEQILKRNRGYIGDLEVSTPSGEGRTLKGTLRVPAAQLENTLIELKALGRIDSESQSGEEVTAQYVDLQARLANSRHTEQRLTEVLQQRTGKLSDVLAVENEIARVRGEIETMEAEQKSMASRVAFATLNLTVTEDYKPKLQTVPPSTLHQFRNSAVEGYQATTEGVVAIVNVGLFYGPSLLLWGVIALLPARYILRKVAAK